MNKKGRVALLIGLGILIFMLSITNIIESNDRALLSAAEHRIHLPLLLKNYQKPFEFGIEIEDPPLQNIDQYFLGQMQAVSLQWALIEPLPDYYDWSSVDEILFAGAALYFKVKGSPLWANGTESRCVLPSVEYWSGYVRLIRAAIERYGAEHVIVGFDVWNEPDTDYALTGGIDLYLGCLGLDYAAGATYAEFYNYVYSEIKPDYPALRIAAGALLNAEHEFFDGMIDNLGAADLISFHVYEWESASAYRYHVLIDHIRARTDLRLGLSETAVICINTSLICEQAQVEFFNFLIEQVEQGVIEFFIWYTLGCRVHQWRNSDMISCDPFYIKPVWFAYADQF